MLHLLRGELRSSRGCPLLGGYVGVDTMGLDRASVVVGGAPVAVTRPRKAVLLS